MGLLPYTVTKNGLDYDAVKQMIPRRVEYSNRLPTCAVRYWKGRFLEAIMLKLCSTTCTTNEWICHSYSRKGRLSRRL